MSNRNESVRLLSDDDLETAREERTEDTPEDLIVFDEDAEISTAARTQGPNDRNTFSNRLVISVLFIVLFGIGAALGYWIVSPAIEAASDDVNIADIQQCTINNLHKDLSFLEDANSIKPEEFIQRRNRLAVALHEDGTDAFVLEPGYTFQYYGNVSQHDWEPWEPEERPFLMVVQPDVHRDGSVTARTTFLCPHFEEARVRQLGIPSDSDLEIVT